jgi:hypothetical protein
VHQGQINAHVRVDWRSSYLARRDSVIPQDKYDQGDGQIAFEHFKKINREFPFMLHPAFHLQEEMQRAVLGQSWCVNAQPTGHVLNANRVLHLTPLLFDQVA